MESRYYITIVIKPKKTVDSPGFEAALLVLAVVAAVAIAVRRRRE
jgi:PGF-CTERM protein